MNWRRLVLMLAVMVCPLFLISCATIISGRTQKMPVITSPTDATVICNGVEQRSPCVLVLDRTVPIYEITIKKEGYKPVTVQLKRGVNGWIFGNIIFGGIIGVIIDVADGSVYQFYPGEISQNLVPAGEIDKIIIKTVEGARES